MDSHEVLIEKEVSEVVVGLCMAELTALEQWKARCFNKDCSTASVARYAMWFALTNPEQFENWMSTVVDYSRNEDICQHKHVRGRIAARYRRKHLKLETGKGGLQ